MLLLYINVQSKAQNVELSTKLTHPTSGPGCVSISYLLGTFSPEWAIIK